MLIFQSDRHLLFSLKYSFSSIFHQNVCYLWGLRGPFSRRGDCGSGFNMRAQARCLEQGKLTSQLSEAVKLHGVPQASCAQGTWADFSSHTFPLAPPAPPAPCKDTTCWGSLMGWDGEK